MNHTFQPVAECDVALIDLDGVVYVGAHAVGHAVASIERAEQAGMRTAYVTNNASRTPGDVAEHLSSLGLRVQAEDVVTSAQAGAHALQRLLADRGIDGPVLAIGGPGVAAALRERGLEVTFSADEQPVAVLQGFGRDVSWADLVEASVAVGRGVVWVATNPDTSIPTPRGRAPGNGAFVHAVHLATGRSPDIVAGKPHRPLIDECLERTAARRALMIGDRLDTDIEAGVNADLPTLLVMTGVTDVLDVLVAPSHQRPDAISLDLRGLDHIFDPIDRADPTATDGLSWTCGPVTVTSDGGIETIVVTGATSITDIAQPESDPQVWARLMRCVSACVWPWIDTRQAAGESREVLATSLARLPVIQALQARVDHQRSRLGE